MRRQKGFSLVELMVVLVVLTVVMGVIFQQIITLQQRYRTEEKRVDMFSEGREFMDQFVRDMHRAGYPSAKVYGTMPAPTDIRLAAGIVAARPGFLLIEGDVDGDGQVDSVAYSVCNNAGVCTSALGGPPGGSCPCTIQRSQVVKAALNPWQQPTFYSNSIEGLVNSLGLSAAGGALNIAGQSKIVGIPGVQNDDALFANMKNFQVFTDYNNVGAVVPSNTNISTVAGQSVIRNIRAVGITMNLLSPSVDPRTGRKPSVALGATAKVPNCSMYSDINVANGWNFTVSGC